MCALASEEACISTDRPYLTTVHKYYIITYFQIRPFNDLGYNGASVRRNQLCNNFKQTRPPQCLSARKLEPNMSLHQQCAWSASGFLDSVYDCGNSFHVKVKCK